jgi:hypothetical protein
MGLSRWILFVSSPFQGYYSYATSQHMTTNRANYSAARCSLFLGAFFGVSVAYASKYQYLSPHICMIAYPVSCQACPIAAFPAYPEYLFRL